MQQDEVLIENTIALNSAYDDVLNNIIVYWYQFNEMAEQIIKNYEELQPIEEQ
jgi:hypothetical protein